MAKKSKKRRHEKDQAGCMWSLLNIFDFRQVRDSQKLLLDKKCGSKRLDGTAVANTTLESLSDSCRIFIDGKDLVENEAATIDAKLSVKELMEEEMCGEEDGEQQGSIGDEDTKQKKNHRWKRSKMSLDLEAGGFIVDGDLVGKPKHRKHKSCSGVELTEMVEELCSRIHQKDIGNLKHTEDGKFNIKRIQDSSAVENKLSEAAKVLVNYFIDGKNGIKERKIQPTKELMDALQMLNSNKEKFLKLHQDPNSQLVEHIQRLRNIQIEEGKFNVLEGSDLLEQDIGNAKQPNYFWRRFNSQEKNSSKKSDSSVDLSRVVVLKPGPPSSKNSDVASTCSSFPASPKSMKEKDEIQKSSSPFTFAEFKRKLKFAMRKEHRDLSHQFSEMLPNIVNRDKKVILETTTMASPSRDHFLVDRIPKSSATFRKVDNIYIEAKRHLAEIVGNTDVDVDTHGRKVPKSLGRILSYSGYNSPTISSPRTGADVRLSDAECQTVDTKTSSDKPICGEEVPATEPIISDWVPAKCSVDKSVQESEVPSSEDIVTGIGSVSQKESNLVDIVNLEQFDCQTRICSKENSLSSTSEQSTCEENEHSSFQDSSMHNCSLCGKMDDIDAMSDATSRPSPISVLEPIFKEDEISPPGIKHFTAVEPIHPRQIKFEEEIAVPIARIPRERTCIDYDKYTFEFVKDVVQMSGLTWTELLRRSLLSDDLIDPSLIDEVDFLPDLLPCDFNLLFDLINEVVVELCWLNYGCMLSLVTPFVDPNSKGKHFSGEVWRKVNWYLKLEVPLRTLEQIISEDFVKQGVWADLQLDSENIGIEIQEVILDELVEETISCFVRKNLHSEISILPVEDEGQITG